MKRLREKGGNRIWSNEESDVEFHPTKTVKVLRSKIIHSEEKAFSPDMDPISISIHRTRYPT